MPSTEEDTVILLPPVEKSQTTSALQPWIGRRDVKSHGTVAVRKFDVVPLSSEIPDGVQIETTDGKASQIIQHLPGNGRFEQHKLTLTPADGTECVGIEPGSDPSAHCTPNQGPDICVHECPSNDAACHDPATVNIQDETPETADPVILPILTEHMRLPFWRCPHHGDRIAVHYASTRRGAEEWDTYSAQCEHTDAGINLEWKDADTSKQGSEFSLGLIEDAWTMDPHGADHSVPCVGDRVVVYRAKGRVRYHAEVRANKDGCVEADCHQIIKEREGEKRKRGADNAIQDNMWMYAAEFSDSDCRSNILNHYRDNVIKVNALDTRKRQRARLSWSLTRVDLLLEKEGGSLESGPEAIEEQTEESHACANCGKAFRTAKSRRGHTAKCLKQTSKALTSTGVDLALRNSRAPLQLSPVIEENTAPYQCSSCGKIFTAQKAVNGHRSYCININARRVEQIHTYPKLDDNHGTDDDDDDDNDDDDVSPRQAVTTFSKTPLKAKKPPKAETKSAKKQRRQSMTAPNLGSEEESPVESCVPGHFYMDFDGDIVHRATQWQKPSCIAAHYHISLDSLIELNRAWYLPKLKKDDKLKEGTAIMLPATVHDSKVCLFPITVSPMLCHAQFN